MLEFKQLVPNFWIGLNDLDYEGVHKWIDGKPLQLTNWYKENPKKDDGKYFGCFELFCRRYREVYFWAQSFPDHNSLSANLTKWVKDTRTIRRVMPTNCLCLFNHFVGLARKGLKKCLYRKKNVLQSCKYHSVITQKLLWRFLWEIIVQVE